MSPSDRNIAFFRPLWRRILLVAVLTVWTGVEAFYGDQIWVLITGGILAYSVWTFFITFPPPDASAPDDASN